jgi:hypothetical protein
VAGAYLLALTTTGASRSTQLEAGAGVAHPPQLACSYGLRALLYIYSTCLADLNPRADRDSALTWLHLSPHFAATRYPGARCHRHCTATNTMPPQQGEVSLLTL